jgi:hypothetical protein
MVPASINDYEHSKEFGGHGQRAGERRKKYGKNRD